jgi:hypothetical protein
MRVGVGVSRSEPDRCYRGNNRVILDRAYGKATLLIQGNVDCGTGCTEAQFSICANTR